MIPLDFSNASQLHLKLKAVLTTTMRHHCSHTNQCGIREQNKGKERKKTSNRPLSSQQSLALYRHKSQCLIKQIQQTGANDQ